MFKFIIYIILTILIFWTIKAVYRIFRVIRSPKRWFPDNKLMQDFMKAVRKGQTEKMDELIKQGADINYQGKDGMTPLMWLLVSSTHNRANKRAFVHLLKKKDIDLTLDLKTRIFSRVAYNVLQIAGMAKDSEWLKMILKYYKPTKEELNVDKNATTVLEEIASVRNLKNFKTLLDYGIDVNYTNESGKNYINLINTGGDSWPFVYYLLKAGVDPFNRIGKFGDSKKEKPYLFWYIEDDPGDSPANIIACCNGIDYRQKVVDYLEKEKGIKLKPWMPKNQKYVEKNGQKVLMIKTKKGKWKEYKKTFDYFYSRYWICAEPIRKLFRKIWNTVYIGI